MLAVVRFAWDPGKSALNLRDRGFDFEFATLIFEGPTPERVDDRRDWARSGSSPSDWRKGSRSPSSTPTGSRPAPSFVASSRPG
jgi:hypothetical protein